MATATAILDCTLAGILYDRVGLHVCDLYCSRRCSDSTPYRDLEPGATRIASLDILGHHFFGDGIDIHRLGVGGFSPFNPKMDLGNDEWIRRNDERH